MDKEWTILLNYCWNGTWLQKKKKERKRKKKKKKKKKKKWEAFNEHTREWPFNEHACIKMFLFACMSIFLSKAASPSVCVGESVHVVWFPITTYSRFSLCFSKSLSMLLLCYTYCTLRQMYCVTLHCNASCGIKKWMIVVERLWRIMLLWFQGQADWLSNNSREGLVIILYMYMASSVWGLVLGSGWVTKYWYLFGEWVKCSWRPGPIATDMVTWQRYNHTDKTARTASKWLGFN